jgi:hypothetical protein
MFGELINNNNNNNFWRFSTTGKAASKLHLGVSMQVVIHTKFAFSRLEQYGYCYN